MLLAVFRFAFVVVIVLNVNVYSRCLFRKTCPCGNRGNNYTRCYDKAIDNYSCERWVNCQTCENNYEFCKTCPPGRSGPTCKDGACPLPKRPKNGLIKCTNENNSYRTSCNVSCIPGFHFDFQPMPENIVVNCEQNIWKPNQNIPDCIPISSHCGLQVTGNGKYNCTLMDGTHCDIICDGKHQGRYHCSEGKGWNPSLPGCVTSTAKKEKAICADPGTPERGGRMDLKGNSITPDHVFMEGETVIYFCKGINGDFQRPTFLTCKPDGSWSGDIPSCEHPQEKVSVQEKSSCKHPGIVENGMMKDFELNSEHFPIGTHLKFQCWEGFQIQGPNSIVCLSNLEWSEDPPVCIDTSTTAPPPPSCTHDRIIENGFILEDEMGSLLPGSALQFKCNEGYTLEGSETIYCIQLSGGNEAKWSDEPPTCRRISSIPVPQTATEIFCEYPGFIENGINENYSPERGRFPVGSTFIFQCKEGYRLVGPERSYCTSNSQWSSDPPKCISILRPVSTVSCPHPGMVKNGRFNGYLTKFSFSVNTSLSFRCNAGYQLVGTRRIVCLDNGDWSSAPPPTCVEVRGARKEKIILV